MPGFSIRGTFSIRRKGLVGRCSPCAKDLVATCKSGRSCAK